MNVQSHHKWWSTLKSAVYGTSSSLPPLVNEGGGLVYETVGLTTFAFKSREDRRLLLDLDPYGGTDQLGMFPFFLRELHADVMAPVLV